MKGIDLRYVTVNQMLRHYSEKQVREEYTRARAIIQKRIKQIEKTGSKKNSIYEKGLKIKGKFYRGAIDPRDYGFYKKYKNGAPKLRGKTSSQAIMELAEMKQWLASPTSTVEGLYKNVSSRVRGLRHTGATEKFPGGYNYFKGLKSSDFASFTSFMEEYRSKKYDRVMGSPEVVEVYTKASQLGLTNEDIMDNLKTLVMHQKELEKANPADIKRALTGGDSLREYLESL